MALEIQKRLIVVEDMDWDSDGSGAAVTVPTADGGTREGTKLGARHVPISQSLRSALANAGSVEEALAYLLNQYENAGGAASADQAGQVQLATNAEVQAGTDALKAVTPAGLSSRTATESRTGLVELATAAEAQAGVDALRAVHPAGLAAALDDVAAVNAVYRNPSPRQCVLSSAVDANGQPDWLVNGGTEVTATGAVTPIVVCFAAGFDEGGAKDWIAKITGALAWTGLTADSTNYLYLDLNTGTLAVTTGHTTTKPEYAYAKGSAAGDYYIIPQGVMYDSGDSAIVRLYVGEAVDTAGAVTALVQYALGGAFVSPWIGLSAGMPLAWNHNLGTVPMSAGLQVRFEAGTPTGVSGVTIAAGDVVIPAGIDVVASSSYACSHFNRMTHLVAESAWGGTVLLPKSTSPYVTWPTNVTQLAVRAVFRRGW